MSNIRVTYSGLIAFVVGLSSVLTGLIFTLIVTRRFSPEEFGLWGLIGSIVAYFLISEVTISFWATRHTARGEKVGKTAILSRRSIRKKFKIESRDIKSKSSSKIKHILDNLNFMAIKIQVID